MREAMIALCTAAILAVSSASGNIQDAAEQDSTGLPGDHFSLQGALEMFKKAGSPEEFEKLLNTQENHVNNLDLNGDGEVDYVRVVGKKENDLHVFVLQVPVSEKESQDIAVIELEKTGEGAATIQIVGDEDIFGEQTIVEPGEGEDVDSDATEEKGGRGPSVGILTPSSPAAVVVNVWAWPCVRFVYAPRYVAWVSPWRWRVYPAWWRTWHPVAWRVFHPFRVRHRTGFAVVHTHRVVRAHKIYAPGRATSVTVRTRHHGAVNKYRVTKTTRVRTTPSGTKVKTTRTKVRKGKR